MRKAFSIAVVMISVMVGVSAQTRANRTGYAEAGTVRLKTDIPATEAEAFSPHTSYSYSIDDFKPGVVRVGPRTTYIKEGLSTDEVVSLLGTPSLISEHNENSIAVTTYEFQRSTERVIIAEFVSGVLVRSWTETRPQKVVQADR